LVVSLNIRWLSHIVRHRQLLGLDSVRIRFAPTSHDLLAQSRGTFTFHFAADRALWECRGTEETGAEVFTLPPETPVETGALGAGAADIGRAGIMSAEPMTLVVGPILGRNARPTAKDPSLPAGDYRLHLWLLEPEATAAGQRVFEVAVRPDPLSTQARFQTLEQVDIFRLAGGRHRLIERTYPVRLEAKAGGGLELRLTPLQGRALLCGMILEPVSMP